DAAAQARRAGRGGGARERRRAACGGAAADASAGRFRAAMTDVPAAAAGAPGASGPTPPLWRRMACFVYEAMLLFGIALVPGALGAVFVAQTGQQHPLQSPTALRVFAWILFGLYFVWLWSARGQTLAMQTWRIRLVAATTGQSPTQLQALTRYVAA